MKKRGMIVVPGVARYPERQVAADHGIDRMIEYAMRMPVPETRSSGSEYPRKPFTIARINSVEPTIQFSSRGLRKAPVKKTRAMWMTIAPRDVAGPVVHLSHQGPRVRRGEIHRRGECLGHLLPVEGRVTAVIGHDRRTRMKYSVKRRRSQQDQERVEAISRA